ncbi:MAG: polysaccharide deacetylase family protein, partial [Gemmatimonadaceae bacterium]
MILGLGAAAVLVGGAAHGAFYRNSPIFGKPLTRTPGTPGERVVALTFDDGPNPDATPPILDALRERGIKATLLILLIKSERCR